MQGRSQSFRRSAVALVAAAGLGLGALDAGPASAGVKPEDLTRTYRLDMDGDRRLDTLTVTVRDPDGVPSWVLDVTTASKIRARAAYAPDPLTAALLGAFGGPVKEWGDLDGAPGAEVFLISGFLPEGGGVSHRVMSLKKGRLVVERLPVRGAGDWSVETQNPRRSGYRVWRTNKVRHAAVLDSTRDRSGRFVGTVTTYRFTGGTWRRVGAPRAVRLTDAQTKAYTNRTGLALTPAGRGR